MNPKLLTQGVFLNVVALELTFPFLSCACEECSNSASNDHTFADHLHGVPCENLTQGKKKPRNQMKRKSHLLIAHMIFQQGEEQEKLWSQLFKHAFEMNVMELCIPINSTCIAPSAYFLR